jgi:hypothetical protein
MIKIELHEDSADERRNASEYQLNSVTTWRIERWFDEYRRFGT